MTPGVESSEDPRHSCLARQTIEMRHRQALLVVRPRQVRVAGVARADRVCLGPGAVRSPGAQASSGIDRRREPPRPAIVIEFASPARRQVLSLRGHGLQAFPSLCRVRAEGGGLEPLARSNQIGTRPPGRWGNVRRSTALAPQSKPVTRASRLVAQVAPLVAFGLGLRILAAGPARVRLYSYRGRLCEPDLKSLLGLVRGHRLIARQQPGPSPDRRARSAGRS